MAAAFELTRLRGKDVAVTVLEASPYVGGKIADATVDDLVVEQGADSFLARDPVAVELARAVGLGDDLIAPSVFGASVWWRGHVRPVPAKTIAAVPCSPWAAYRSGLVSVRGALRMERDLFALGRAATEDTTIAELVGGRLGREALEGVTDALLAGSRAGLPNRIGVAAGARDLYAVATSNRSLMRGLRRAERTGAIPSGSPDFRAPRARMADLVTAVASHLDVRTKARVARVQGRPGGVAVDVEGGQTVAADAAVIAVPAFEAARLLGNNGRIARELGEIDYASVAVVTLVYSDPPPGPLIGSGILVPSRAERTMSACTWYSRKWAQRNQGGKFVARAVVGGAERAQALDLSDDELSQRVATELHEAVGLGDFDAAHVTRWERALPEFKVGHLDLVQRIEAEMAAQFPPIRLAGAGLSGSGIPDCIHNGYQAARSIADYLQAQP